MLFHKKEAASKSAESKTDKRRDCGSYSETGELPDISCLISILESMKPGVDFANEISLIDSHILDSVDIMSLAMDIEEYFHVEVTPLEIVPENFQSANAIYEMILRLNAAKQ